MNKNKEKQVKPKEGIPRLFELAGEKRSKITAACILAVISSGTRIVSFFMIYEVIKEVLISYLNPAELNMHRIWIYGIITLIGVLGYGVCAYLSSSIAHTAAYDLLYEIRMKLMDKLSRISAGFFTGTTQGSIKKIMTDDVEQIENFVAHSLCDIAASIATPLFTMIFLFILDWRLALVTLIPLIISICILGSCLQKKDKAELQVEMHDSLEKMSGTIVEYIHGMPVVKTFNRSLGAFKRYEDDINSFVNVVDKTAKANASPMGAYYAFFGAQLLFLLPASIFLLSRAESYIDFLPIVLLFFLVGQGLKEPMENMMNMVIMSGRIVEGVKRIDHILYQPEITVSGNELPDTYDVSFNHVSFSYTDGMDVIDDISFDVKQGSVNGIVGPSGGGKSTLMELLLRFYDVKKGSIRIGGVDIRDIPMKELMNMICYVFQDSVLFRDTVENNIRMGNRDASMEEIHQAAENAGVHEVIMNLPNGYQTVIGEENTFLSGGEKQRIAIARIFLKNTPIVVLDEATAYADAENETKIQNAFAKLSKNKTVFIIAHRLKTIEHADSIFVIREGKCNAYGTHEELLQSCELYRDMVAANERRDAWTIDTEGGTMK